MVPDEEQADVPVIVAVCWGRPTAAVIQSKLDSAGVKAHVKAEAVASLYGTSVDGLGRMEVQVAAADAERAREVLASAEELPDDAELPDC